jgi:hypothetical protein
MPIKFPKTDYRIPSELKFLMPLIEKISQYEKFINLEHEQYFCHLTFYNNFLEPNSYQVYPGFHVDGFQGANINPKTKIEHSYVLSTNPTTEFCIQPFFLNHLDESKHNFFLELDRQAKKENIYSTLNNHLYLIDSYMVHRSPKIIKPTFRTMIKVTYSFYESEHIRNTINPFFDGQKYENRVKLKGNFSPFEFEPPYHLYGLKNK